MQHPIVPVIICGGAEPACGRHQEQSFPKQFIALLGEQSMFQKTLSRVSGPLFAEPVIVTHADFRFLVASQVMQMGMNASILLEPARRDSGPAVAAAAAFVEAHLPGAQMIVLPSDHLVLDEGAFLSAVKSAAAAADEGRIVTFGMILNYPATGFGYIQPGRPQPQA